MMPQGTSTANAIAAASALLTPALVTQKRAAEDAIEGGETEPTEPNLKKSKPN
jgi:hypothetical protein